MAERIDSFNSIRIMAFIKVISTFLSLLIVSAAFPQEAPFTVTYKVGDRIISVVENCFNQCKRNVLFLNVHDNEETSVQAARAYLNENSGLLVTINNDSLRNISFGVDGTSYTFDPNRIFSDKGVTATLKTLSTTGDEAETEINYFANELKRSYIDSSKFIVALHNNTDSNLSVLSYQHTQDSLPGTGKVYINTDMDIDDFILTTDTTIFNILQERNINAVWENNSLIEDDGSLSVYTGLHDIPYINVEAQHGHFDEQLRMLRAIDDIINRHDQSRYRFVEKTKISAAEYRLAPDK